MTLLPGRCSKREARRKVARLPCLENWSRCCGLMANPKGDYRQLWNKLARKVFLLTPLRISVTGFNQEGTLNLF
jgi:hypothetical protein